MSRYRRTRTEGGTYFFTIVTYRRQRFFLREDLINDLRQAITDVRQKYPFKIDAWVLLPDHIHCIWTLPKKDNDYSKRIGMIKAQFTSRAKKHLEKPQWITPSKSKHRESTIWQRRFWEHEIRNNKDFERHVDYVHFNPVKHDLVNAACDWPYSTFHRYVKSGVYSKDWAGAKEDTLIDFGE